MKSVVNEHILSDEQKTLLKKMTGEISKANVKAVSFKMKDILVVSPFSSVRDMFMLMENDFRKVSKSGKSFTQLRVDAQDSAVKKYGKTAVTIDIIYSILSKTGKIKKEDTEILMKRECELIERFSFVRECGNTLFREAKKNGKKTIIIAETVYPKQTIDSILEKCGYGSYDSLITNPENFEKIQEVSGVEPSELLHIGGNVEKDVEEPILKGSKAILISPVIPLMVKSGRLRGFIESEILLDADSPKYLALRCAFGLYAMYGFDIPQNKLPKSDFCKNPYMLGFIVYGTLSLIEDDYKYNDSLTCELGSPDGNNQKILKGRDDFIKMFSECFGGFYDDMKHTGLELPFEFLAYHSAPADRMLLRSCISDGTYKNWSESVTEPETAPVYARTVKKNAVSKLADKLFPPGTKVRTIADGILAKSHR
ncbi:MAG: hypothetical protein J6B74_08215 [Ruminococcus sp.]|nr:hypothetical protein [Ruminococcus sp.]